MCDNIIGQWVRRSKRVLIWGATEEPSISVTQEGLLVSVIIWWLNGTTQSWARRGAQTADWWWLVQKQTTDYSLAAADADIFIQLAQLTVIKENETLRVVCMWRRKGKKNKGRDQRFSLVTVTINRPAGCKILYERIQTNTHWLVHTHRHTHMDRYTHWLRNKHAHKYLCWTEASFPALLYLMHIKYHFPERIPQCFVFVEHREILSWLPSTGYYKHFYFITDSICAQLEQRNPKTSMKKSRWENDTYSRYFSCG